MEYLKYCWQVVALLLINCSLAVFFLRKRWMKLFLLSLAGLLFMGYSFFDCLNFYAFWTTKKVPPLGG